jgi:hypothetical protein
MKKIVYNQVFKDQTDFFETLVDDALSEYSIPTDNIKEIDGFSELGRRVFVITEDKEYMIRLWSMGETDDELIVDYSVFQEMGDESVELGV